MPIVLKIVMTLAFLVVLFFCILIMLPDRIERAILDFMDAVEPFFILAPIFALIYAIVVIWLFL